MKIVCNKCQSSKYCKGTKCSCFNNLNHIAQAGGVHANIFWMEKCIRAQLLPLNSKRI